MAKKVLYLGNGKWCWTDNCSQHAKVIEAKNRYLAAKTSGSEKEVAAATKALVSTPEGLSTYRYLQTQALSETLGRKPTLGLDLDGTTGDFTDGLRTYMAQGLQLPKDKWLSFFPEPDEYAMWQGKNAWYKDKDDFFSNFQKAEKDGIYQQMRVFDNAKEVLTELRAYGFDVKVITARGAEFNSDTQKWISTHCLPLAQILNPGNEKHTVPNIDLYMDDSPYVINTLLEHQKKVVVMDQLYNAHNVADTDNSKRVKGWSNDVIDAIFDLLDKKKTKP